MTYQQAYDKIIQAYFKDEIKPFNSRFCFCGTLCGNKKSWMNKSYRQRFHNYSLAEYGMMEAALFSAFPGVTWVRNGDIEGPDFDQDSPQYEEYIFLGMCAALDVLKEIHRSRGEDVDSLPALTKRNLQNT